MLSLEKQRGYDNKAVLGGLERLADTWAPEAITQVDEKEERLLIEEIASLLRRYPSLEGTSQRAALVEDMLGKVADRPAAPVPEEVLTEPSRSAPSTLKEAGPPAPVRPAAPERSIDGLESPITRLPGIKRGYAGRMENLGVETIGDMLALYPTTITGRSRP